MRTGTLLNLAENLIGISQIVRIHRNGVNNKNVHMPMRLMRVCIALVYASPQTATYMRSEARSSDGMREKGTRAKKKTNHRIELIGGILITSNYKLHDDTHYDSLTTKRFALLSTSRRRKVRVHDGFTR